MILFGAKMISPQKTDVFRNHLPLKLLLKQNPVPKAFFPFFNQKKAASLVTRKV